MWCRRRFVVQSPTVDCVIRIYLAMSLFVSLLTELMADDRSSLQASRVYLHNLTYSLWCNVKRTAVDAVSRFVM
jgi:hypothetical protein